MKVPDGKTVYIKARKYKAGEELPKGYTVKEGKKSPAKSQLSTGEKKGE